MMVLLLLLLMMMVMTVVQGCTVVVVAGVASGYRGVTLERNSVTSAAAQIDGVGVIVVAAVCGGESTTTANYDIVVVLKASIVVVVVVDYDASVASGDTAADCAGVAGRVASGDDVMLLVGRMSGQMLLQDKLVGGGFHRDG